MLQTRKNRISMELPNKNQGTIKYNLHKLYLILAILLGTISAVVSPIFNEPDGPYHFEASAKIVGLVVDTSRYGESEVTSGMSGQSAAYLDGTHFEKYYLNQAYITSYKNIPRDISEKPDSFAWWGHLVPAAGILIGYHIYPSLGVMTIFGRLLPLFIYSLAMFFIIKRLRRGKLTFTALMLSPVVISQFSSFSYDALSYLIVAAAIALAINIVDRNKIDTKSILELLLMSGVLYMGVKTNFKTIIAFYPLIVFAIFYTRYKEKRVLKRERLRGNLSEDDLITRVHKKSSVFGLKFLLIGSGVFASLAALILALQSYGGIIYVLKRFVFNLIRNLASSSLLSMFSSPYRTNQIPAWVTIAWFIVFAICLLSEEHFVKSKLISYGAGILFLANIAAVYFSFMVSGYVDSTTSTANQILGAISGVQGRYFTPLLLLLILFVGNKKFKVKVEMSNSIIVTVVGLVVVSNVILIINSLWTLISA